MKSIKFLQKSVFRLVLLGFLVGSFSACKKGEEPSAAITNLGLQLSGIENYKVDEKKTFKVRDHAAEEVLLSDGPNTLSIKVLKDMTSETALKYFESRTYLIERLYSQMKSPYPGEISATIKCGNEFRPKTVQKKESGMNELTIQALANSRKVFGICDESQIAFKASIIVIHCETSGKLYDIEAFFAAGAPPQTIGPARCL